MGCVVRMKNGTYYSEYYHHEVRLLLQNCIQPQLYFQKVAFLKVKLKKAKKGFFLFLIYPSVEVNPLRKLNLVSYLTLMLRLHPQGII